VHFNLDRRWEYTIMNLRNVVAGALCVVAIAMSIVLPSLASAEVVRAVEYYHQAFEHYFVTANPTEVAAFDSGMFQGWWRTGQRYRVDDAPAADLVPVCRFYTSAFAGKASHFFTASPTECASLKKSPHWTYESVAFYARVPDAQGNCGAGIAAIHRLFNNGQGGAPNHAYTAYDDKKNTLVGAGWIQEGVAYCTPLAAADPMAQTLVLNGSTWDLPAPAAFLSATVDGRVRTQFVPITARSIEGAVYDFAYYGLAVPPTPIMHNGQSPSCNGWGCSGAAAWDPLAGAYVLFIDVYADKKWAGIMWTFDNAQGPTTPVCMMGIWDNVVSHQPYIPSPFQDYIFSGCEPGVANTCGNVRVVPVCVSLKVALAASVTDPLPVIVPPVMFRLGSDVRKAPALLVIVPPTTLITDGAPAKKPNESPLFDWRNAPAFTVVGPCPRRPVWPPPNVATVP
jgi:hypothetical protein